ncbi:MAG: GAF domain-containing protein [Acidobacteriaceae bacterium]
MSLETVIATAEFVLRRSRAPDYELENQALHRLAALFSHAPGEVLQQLVDSALDLCDAESSGISLAETQSDGSSVFRWIATAGRYQKYAGGTTPRNHSPCGITVDRASVQLVRRPERYFEYLRAEDPAESICEGLLVPWYVDASCYGTIWVITHREDRHFDGEDLRRMSSLADFAAAAIRHSSAEGEVHVLLRLSAAQEVSNQLAHRINNPLQGLSNLLSLIDLQPARAKELITDAQVQLGRVTGLVQEILMTSSRRGPKGARKLPASSRRLG